MIGGLLLLAIIVALITIWVKTKNNTKKLQELEEQLIKNEEVTVVKEDGVVNSDA
ncbi:MAG: hypothetical protein HQK77_14820 [Desulfobacterales bacterium]|nr:hypothetical protein [Desulfobacterales bacterium]